MRLIDGDALIEAIDKLPTTPLWHDMQKEGVIWEILNAPTVATDINVPVKLTDEAAIEHLYKIGFARVEHGYWSRKGCVKKQQYDRTTDCYARAHRCSVCNSVSYFPIDIPDDYCRRCGAKMDELMPEPPEEENEDE